MLSQRKLGGIRSGGKYQPKNNVIYHKYHWNNTKYDPLVRILLSTILNVPAMDSLRLHISSDNILVSLAG